MSKNRELPTHPLGNTGDLSPLSVEVRKHLEHHLVAALKDHDFRAELGEHLRNDRRSKAARHIITAIAPWIIVRIADERQATITLFNQEEADT